MRRYAEDTSVAVDRSRAQIETLVRQCGATAFQSGWSDGQSVIGFLLHDRALRFRLPLPRRDAKEFSVTPGRGRQRDERTIDALWEQACRARWRALFLSIKAKMTAVEEGIEVFDTAFLSNIVDPASGKTIGETIVPQLAISYDRNKRDQKPIALLTDATA